MAICKSSASALPTVKLQGIQSKRHDVDILQLGVRSPLAIDQCVSNGDATEIDTKNETLALGLNLLIRRVNAWLQRHAYSAEEAEE